MFTIRGGPRALMLEPKDSEFTRTAFLNHPKMILHMASSPDMKDSYYKMFNSAKESMTIVHLAKQMKPLLSFENQDYTDVFVVDSEAEALLIEIINAHDTYGINRVRMAPKQIVMKIIGNPALYFEAVKEDVHAEAVHLSELYEKVSTGAIILLTEESLTKNLRLDEFMSEALVCDESYAEVKRHLTTNQMKYANAALQNRDWFEMKIKIYDSYGNFKTFHDRLMAVIDDLDLGFVFGESWGTDAALAFLSVGVYTVRLISFLPPKEIKAILLGLEYDAEGHRLVDYDLYHKRFKISWSDIRQKGQKYRDEVGIAMRSVLDERLTEQGKNDLLENDAIIHQERLPNKK